jgi:putative acetyltransferase
MREQPEQNWKVRPATDADGDAVAAVIATAFAEYPGCIFDRQNELPELDALASHYRKNGGMFWVVELEGRIVGCVGIDLLADGATWELHRMYVLAEHRGSGIARALLGTAIGHARKCGAARIELWSDTRFARGHRFYEKSGFRFTGHERELRDLSNSREYHYELELEDESSAAA